MLGGGFLREEIKERLSEIGKIDNDVYQYLLDKRIEFGSFKVLKRGIAQTIKRYLVRMMGFERADLREWPGRFLKEYRRRLTVKELVERINQPSRKKRILFVTGSPTYNIIRQSIYLRKAGYETILLMGTSLSLADFAEKYFDIVYIFNSIYTLSHILKEARPYLIHVQGATRNSNHFGILGEVLSNSKMVFNFYDIPSTTIAGKDIEAGERDLVDVKEIQLDLFSERFACERADGLIFGYSGEVGEILKERYNTKSPMLEFQSYPCDEFVSNGSIKYSDSGGKVHIVYGGHVAPSHLPEQYFGDCQFHSVIEQLTKQGLYFDIYVLDVSFRRIKRDYGDYLALAEENPLFNFKRGAVLDKATEAFSRYDFGAMIYPYYKGEVFRMGEHIMKEHVRMRLPDKFFTYMEAGLPIIVSEELAYAARLVKEYEIGIVLRRNDLDNLSEIINSYDREKLKANVKKAREELSMKRNIGRLISFYEQVVESKQES